MATASDSFCNDKKVINFSHHWTIDDFPSYLSSLTLGAEEVSAGVGVSVSLVVLVCMRFNCCRRLLISSSWASICWRSFCCLCSLRCCCSFLSCSRSCMVFSFSCSWRLRSNSCVLSSPSLFPLAGVGILFWFLKL